MIPAQRIADAINQLGDGQKIFMQTEDEHVYLEFSRINGALDYRCCFQDAIGMDVLDSVHFMEGEFYVGIYEHSTQVVSAQVQSLVYAYILLDIDQDNIVGISSILPMAFLDEEDES